MSTITLTFPDGSEKTFQKGTTGKEVVEGIGAGLAHAAIAITLNGTTLDLVTPIRESGDFKVLKITDKETLDVVRHSASHILAQAVLRLYPKTKLGIGPAVEEGFYYDMDIGTTLSPADLEAIEAEMHKIIKEDHAFMRREMSKEDARRIFAHQPFKLELINELEEGEISVYVDGDFTDLCRGPHVPSTGIVKAVKLTKVAGAYWRGDAKNAQLQRVYGIAFSNKKELDEHLHLLEEAGKRDHRKLGHELELFMQHEYAPGSPFILPKGTVIYNELLSFMRKEYLKRGYKEVVTPQLFNKKLWETSGHWSHYRENMFLLNVDGEEFSLKPMNCPSHVLIFKKDAHSYRDLPIRIADFCALHRNELKGVLGGMTRVRKFSQDDAHIFCTQDQIEDEIQRELALAKYVYSDVFKMRFSCNLSTRPAEFLGSAELWDKAEDALRKALEKSHMQYAIKPGDGAFYGPKIDFDIHDALGRQWQLATIQLDFQMPLRFGAEYEGRDGKRHHVIMVHRAILGSMERFIAILIEHFAGKFPLWLAPVQAKILTVADRHEEYAEKIRLKMIDAGLRCDVDMRAESISKKVREAQLEKVNYILVIGDKELAEQSVSVRRRDNQVLGERPYQQFILTLCEEAEERRLADY